MTVENSGIDLPAAAADGVGTELKARMVDVLAEPAPLLLQGLVEEVRDAMDRPRPLRSSVASRNRRDGATVSLSGVGHAVRR